MADHYDHLETRSADERAAWLGEHLQRQIKHAKTVPAYEAALADIDPDEIDSVTQLTKVPVLRKASLIERQGEDKPFGGINAVPASEAGRLFTSPGPIFEMEGRESDYGRTARGLFAAGFRKGEVLHNSFAYHLTPGGWILDWGARVLGCAVIAAGIGQTEQQAQAIAQFHPNGYAGTPDYLMTILEKADELGLDCSSITKGFVSGGALFPSLRDAYAERGVSVLQGYATAELGLVAYETKNDDGALNEGMVVDEGVIVEIVRPGTGDPVPAGEVGEVVVTTFNCVYPMVRLATGDLSAVLPGESPCGRTNLRIKGWMGRADQTTKVKGMFVHPEQIAAVVERHPEIAKARLVVTRDGTSDIMTLQAESESQDEALASKVAGTLQSATKLKGAVELVAPGSLANDGKVIDDARDYES